MQQNRPRVVVALLLAMFMAALEATVVSTAMPSVVADLGGIGLYGWVGASYLLASTVTMPVYGKLADTFGRRPLLLFGIVLFLLGSVASGFSRTIDELIAFRVVQGLGAGALQPVALTVVGDLFTVKERGKVQGAFGAIWAVAGIAGPLAGGAIVSLWTWHWVFWINVPFGLASAALLLRYYREAPPPPRRALDLAGAALLTGAATLILTGASGVHPAALLAAGALLAALFVRAEARALDPVLPLSLMARRSVAVATVCSLLLGAAMAGTLHYLPLYVQGARGGTPTEAGMVVAPMLVGWPVASAITSRAIVRVGFRAPIQLGAVVTAVALVSLAWALPTTPRLVTLAGLMTLFGFGMGLASTSIIIALQAGVAHTQRGVATASNLFARTLGSALGAGALGALLVARLGHDIPPERVSGLLAPGRRALAAGDVALAALLGHALGPVFVATAALAVVNLAVVALYPRREHRDDAEATTVRSGLDPAA